MNSFKLKSPNCVVLFPSFTPLATSLTTAPDFSKVDTTVEVSEDANLAELIEIFKEPSRYHRLHRVAVVDKHDKLVNVVSQSDIIALAVANIETIPEAKVRL